MHDRIDERLEKIDEYYGAASTKTREEADEILPWSEIYRLDDDDHFLRFIRNELEGKKDARDKGERAKALCKCADRACAVKQGELPPETVPRRGALEAIERGAEERVDAYVNGDHEDVAVGEALDAWIDRYAEILPALTQAVSLLEDDVESTKGLVDV